MDGKQGVGSNVFEGVSQDTLDVFTNAVRRVVEVGKEAAKNGLLATIQRVPGSTAEELAAVIGMSVGMVRLALDDHVEAGRVRRLESGGYVVASPSQSALLTLAQQVDRLIDEGKYDQAYLFMGRNQQVTYHTQLQRLRALGQTRTFGAGIHASTLTRQPTAHSDAKPPAQHTVIKPTSRIPSGDELRSLTAAGKKVVISANGYEIVDKDTSG